MADDVRLDVSVVICTRNRADFLDGILHALASIASGRRWEVLILDNNSADDTKRRIAEADDCGGRLHYHHVARVGLGAARDAGWRLAAGHIIAFTDDDCYPESDYVDAIVEAFDDAPSAGCIGGRILLFDPTDARVTLDERDEPVALEPARFVDAGALHGANLAVRRDVLELIDGFDPLLGAGTRFPCEDIDVVARVLWSGATVRFDPRFVVWHHHRRKEKDIPALFVGYDRGRGAYYAKFLLRQETRAAYLRGWFGIAQRRSTVGGLVRMVREADAAIRYLLSQRAYTFLALALPLGLIAYAAVMSLVALRILRKVWRRRRSNDKRDSAQSSARCRRPSRVGAR